MNLVCFPGAGTHAPARPYQVRHPYPTHVLIRLGRWDDIISLPHFCLYEVVSLHTCVLPYTYRKTLEMLLKLMKLYETMGGRFGRWDDILSHLDLDRAPYVLYAVKYIDPVSL